MSVSAFPCPYEYAVVEEEACDPLNSFIPCGRLYDDEAKHLVLVLVLVLGHRPRRCMIVPNEVIVRHVIG